MTASALLRPSRPFLNVGSAPAPRPALVVRAALVVDRDPATRAEALAALAVFPDAEVKCAATRAEAEHLMRRRHFDLAVVDLDLPDDGGPAVVRRLASPTPGLGARPTVCVPSAGPGCDAPGRLRTLLLAAARGDLAADAVLAQRVPDDVPPVARHEPSGPEPSLLSPRETDVLRLAVSGHTVAAVAAALGLSENTVKAHLKRAYRKLNVRTRAEAAGAARRLGLWDGGAG